MVGLREHGHGLWEEALWPLPFLASVALGEDSCSSGSREEGSLIPSSESIESHQDWTPVLPCVCWIILETSSTRAF